MLNKIAIWSLYLLSLALIINSLSHTFDGDLGWHLRFGKEIIQNAFPHTDTYTYKFAGREWVNHEWGGDIIFWFLYNNFAYAGLIVFTGLSVWLGLILSIKNFHSGNQKNNAVATVLLALALHFILTVRLAMLSTLFFALIIFTLEKTDKKYYRYWPIIFWMWAALHGSWILGFIIIGIYFCAFLLKKIIPEHYNFLSGKKMPDDNKTYRQMLVSAGISMLAVAFNPYGLKIWTEVLNYFSEGYFKQHVTEWLPSYTYPIYPWPLILGAIALVFIIWGHIKKKVTLAQTLLFLAILYATVKHKRNNLYLLILLAPILANIFTLIVSQIKWPNKKNFTDIFNVIIITSAGLFAILQITRIDLTPDPFSNTTLLNRYGFPQAAVNFLKQNGQLENTKIFNEFWWGGYLNWTLPDAKVFLDGRGTATWRLNKEETLLENYHRLKFETGGLKELENDQVKYVILNRNASGYSLPNKFNDWMFSADLPKIFSTPEPHLTAMLKRSKKWQLIHEDRWAVIWKNLQL